MPEKTNLLWDIGNVLISFDYTNAFKKLAEYLNPLTAMMLWAKKDDFMKEIRTELDLLETGRMTLQQLFSRLKGKIGLNMEYDQFHAVWCGIFELKEDVIACAHALGEKYDAYFLSNTNKAHFDYLMQTYPQLGFVKGQALSYELGVMKPSREFFEKMLGQFGLNADECLFIDDNPGNISSAAELGIDGIVFENLPQLQSALAEKGIA